MSLFPGTFWLNAPNAALQAIVDERAVLLITEAIIAEFADVISRPKLAKYLEAKSRTAEQVVEEVRDMAEIVQPAPVPAGVIRDPKDEMILACAIGGKANYIVSGDNDLLDLKEYERIPIISVIDFLKLLQETDET